MSFQVAVYVIPDHHRSRVTCQAMLQGLQRRGVRVCLRREDAWTEGELHQTCIFYGLEGNTPAIFRNHVQAGCNAVYIDLGYWGRRAGGRWTGYHKLVRNSRHPTAYFQSRKHDAARFCYQEIPIGPWRRGPSAGECIVLAGMGDKGAIAEGFAPEAWERWAMNEIRKYSDRPVIYRPKPSWKFARPIPGARFAPATVKIEDVLAKAWCVVTHHSNVAVDALLAGIPVFCWAGIASALALQDLSKLEKPWRPDGREQWAADAAWCQWSIAEMSSGAAWDYLSSEVLS